MASSQQLPKAVLATISPQRPYGGSREGDLPAPVLSAHGQLAPPNDAIGWPIETLGGTGTPKQDLGPPSCDS
jgi:hypothetical protein